MVLMDTELFRNGAHGFVAADQLWPLRGKLEYMDRMDGLDPVMAFIKGRIGDMVMMECILTMRQYDKEVAT